MTTASSSAEHAVPAASSTPLHVTIRFSNSHPDLDLDIPSPDSTTVLALKYLLRTSIASKSRLRLIYRGRLLPDTAALSSVLSQPQEQPPPPPPSDHVDPSGKGKARLEPPPALKLPLQRVYVNCSIGDELSEEELAEERDAASLPPDASASGRPGLAPPTSTRPRPRGFDRLLQSGFTASEIATLRTQFASIHNERFAPDSLPSPDTMRGLEDAWIDNNAGDGPNAAAARAFEDEGSSMATVLDVLIRGMMIGFFFPLGSMTWLLRQDGIWSEKWQIFVGSGVVLSLTVGIVMGLSSTP
ncbi:hypothetical protein NLU13_4444 [Sarocladium strictum]|uniref:Ubiquitin-like domain-containing protein n=1 Tax=Sarocladium strictum TaxID=5046 RepID=A0AA39GJP5_SARSR|nr:hypothetical protein NLU13_4444 [Sarocladium strictum]